MYNTHKMFSTTFPSLQTLTITLSFFPVCHRTYHYRTYCAFCSFNFVCCLSLPARMLTPWGQKSPSVVLTAEFLHSSATGPGTYVSLKNYLLNEWVHGPTKNLPDIGSDGTSAQLISARKKGHCSSTSCGKERGGNTNQPVSPPS